MTSTALIIGASGGIGYELAKLFAKDRTFVAESVRFAPRRLMTAVSRKVAEKAYCPARFLTSLGSFVSPV